MENILKMKTTYKLLLFALAMSIFSNCGKEETPEPDPEPTPDDKIAYILNEGNYQQNEASITHFNITKIATNSDYFDAVNGFKLGDVLQSMGENEENYFIVVNNSAKIEVVDKKTFESVMTITDMGSPRYFLNINDTLAYVTDLFANEIYQINPVNGNKYNGIEVNSGSEQLERIDDEVYVALFGSRSIGVIDIASQSMIDWVSLDLFPSQMVKDKFNKLWVLGIDYNGTSKLYRIDAINREIENEWLFQFNNPVIQLAIDPAGENIYYGASKNGDITINIVDVLSENMVFPDVILQTNILNLYGLDVNKEGDIYTCDALYFAQQGVVYVYNKDYELTDSISAGIGPNGVVFSD
jgi:hypothetical protein